MTNITAHDHDQYYTSSTCIHDQFVEYIEYQQLIHHLCTLYSSNSVQAAHKKYSNVVQLCRYWMYNFGLCAPEQNSVVYINNKH